MDFIDHAYTNLEDGCQPCHGLWWLLRWRRLLGQNSTSWQSQQVAVHSRTTRKGTAQYGMAQTCLPCLRALCDTLDCRGSIVIGWTLKVWNTGMVDISNTAAAATSVGVGGVSSGAALSKSHPKIPQGVSSSWRNLQVIWGTVSYSWPATWFPHGFSSSGTSWEYFAQIKTRALIPLDWFLGVGYLSSQFLVANYLLSKFTTYKGHCLSHTYH